VVGVVGVALTGKPACGVVRGVVRGARGRGAARAARDGRELAGAPGTGGAEEERGQAELARRAEEQAVAQQREDGQPDVRAELLGHAWPALSTLPPQSSESAWPLLHQIPLLYLRRNWQKHGTEGPESTAARREAHGTTKN
jgi:hypothetical protein